MSSQSIHELFEETYNEATPEEKYNIDLWESLHKVIYELEQLTIDHNIPAEQVRRDLQIRKSTMKRFLSYGLIPRYNFLCKLANYFGSKLHVSLYGDYTVTLDTKYHDQIKKLAKERNLRPHKYLEALLEESLKNK